MSNVSAATHPSALILIADGTEEMEFTITYDTLVRAGVSVVSAFIHEDPNLPSATPPAAKCSRGLRIIPDVHFEPRDSGPDRYDLLIIPGGAKGADTITKNKAVQSLVKAFIEKDKIVGMICAGSLGALTSGLPRQRVTSHPSVRQDLEKGSYIDITDAARRGCSEGKP